MTTSATIERLRRHPIFAAADPTALELMATKSTLRTLEAKEILYRTGDPAAHVFVLSDGLIRVFQATPDGRETTVTTLLAPNAFGEKTIIAEDASGTALGYPESTQALKRSSLIEVPGAAFLAFLRASPGSTFELLRDICCRFAASARREVDVMLPIPVRLASLLLSYAEAAGIATPDGMSLRVPLTHDDLAKGLGTATKSVARTLKEWADDDLVVRKKGWFVLRRPDDLAKLCGEARLDLVYRYRPER